jgi:hypothetical protein
MRLRAFNVVNYARPASAPKRRQRCINLEVKLRADVGRFAVGCLHERENGHASGIPAVHGFVTNLALCIASLLERQTSRRHLIFGPAIGTFEDDHGLLGAY